jgi:hypothetical protein
MEGMYHYHEVPLSLIAQQGADALLGYLLDGFPVYGPVEDGGTLTSADLDEYHGHSHATPDYPQGIYHYHTTYDSPYINGNGFYGTAGTVQFNAPAPAVTNSPTASPTPTPSPVPTPPPNDADGDGVLDATDNCPAWPNPGQALPPWNVPAGDGDCDGYTVAAETFLGTGAAAHCASSPATADEPDPDAWPLDFDDDQVATTLDLGVYASRLNTTTADQEYLVRADLSLDGAINTLDLGPYASSLNMTCA